jgi:S-adenosylmethionine:tRNA ribosyltransferase-isomerase
MAGQAMHTTDALTVDDFDYALPGELIAQHPLPERSASRLLKVDADGMRDLQITDLTRLLRPGDLLVFNDTQVIPARLHGRKPTGGKVEVLIERVLEAKRAVALLRTSHKPRTGSTFTFGQARATVQGRRDDLFVLEFDQPVLALLQQHGEIPLPPYIVHTPGAVDAERYQTVYAARPGAVAAPTAGLHFTKDLLEQLSRLGVELAQLTLHVGAGTFQPVREHSLDDHRMHSEWFEISAATADAVERARAAQRRVIAIGTTSLRALESAALADGRVLAGTGETALFIKPGFEFKVVDALLTNFHLPRSTLLMLVSAFAGMQRIRDAYAHAIAQRYRFFSYGDAMLLERAR